MPQGSLFLVGSNFLGNGESHRSWASDPLVRVTLDNLGLQVFFSKEKAIHLLAVLDVFAHRVVTDRRDHSIEIWKDWINEDHSAHTFWRLRADLIFPLSPFLVCPRFGYLIDPKEMIHDSCRPGYISSLVLLGDKLMWMNF